MVKTLNMSGNLWRKCSKYFSIFTTDSCFTDFVFQACMSYKFKIAHGTANQITKTFF